MPGGDGPRGATDLWGFVPDHGPARRLVDPLVDVGDLDGDGAVDPVFEHCTPLPIYGRACKLVAWFPKNEVTWSGRLPGGNVLAPRMLDGRRRLVILPASGTTGDVLPPEDVTVLTFAPGAVAVTDGTKLYAAESAAGRRRAQLASCENPSWREAADLSRNAAENTDIRVDLAAKYEPTPAAQAVWHALPKPVGHCRELPEAERTARRTERTKAITDRAALRFAEVTNPVEVGFGCTSKDETPVLVTWAESTVSEPVWSAELYDLHGGALKLLSSTRSYWGMEWNDVQTLTLGPSADLDGDGEDETAVLGTAYEVGAMSAPRVAAVVRGDALVQAPATFYGPAFVAALDAKRAVLVLPTPATDPDNGPLPWPPSTFALEGGKLVRRGPVWPSSVQAARAAFR